MDPTIIIFVCLSLSKLQQMDTIINGEDIYPLKLLEILNDLKKLYMNIHFVTTFSLIFTLFFTLSLYCFGFCANTYFFFVNYGCHISCQPNDCSNNTHKKNQLVE